MATYGCFPFRPHLTYPLVHGRQVGRRALLRERQKKEGICSDESSSP
jgi:hypothetical protein